MDVYGHPFGASEEASPLGFPEDGLQAGREEQHQVLRARIPYPAEDYVGAGGVPALVLEDGCGGLDGVLGRGREEDHVPDRVPRVDGVGGRFQAGAFAEGLLDKPISLLVLVSHEARASRERLSLLGLAFPGNFMLKGE